MGKIGDSVGRKRNEAKAQSIRIIKSDLYSIFISMGEQYENAVIRADYERTAKGSKLFIRTMIQVEPYEKQLTGEEKQAFIKAILDWNAHLKTISFV